mgnify:FL=1
MNPPTMITLEELENNSTPSSSSNEFNLFELVPIPTNESKELIIIPYIPLGMLRNLEINPNKELLDKIPENVKTII